MSEKPVFFEFAAGQLINLNRVENILQSDNYVYVNMDVPANNRLITYSTNNEALNAYAALVHMFEKNGIKIIP